MNHLKIRPADSDCKIAIKAAVLCALLFTIFGGAFVELIPNISLSKAYGLLAMTGFLAGLYTDRDFWLKPWT